MNCLIIQPIHPIGEEILEAAGIMVLKRTERRPTIDEVAAAVAGVDTVITRDAPFQRPVFERAKNLKAIAIHGIGANPIDLCAATDHGVMICRTPDANIQSVAEHAIGLMLALGTVFRTYIKLCGTGISALATNLTFRSFIERPC